MWFHDLRRTAITNLDRAGVSLKTRMKIVEHKTVTQHLAYRIAPEDELREAISLQNSYLEQQKALSSGKVSGKVTGKIADLEDERKKRVSFN